MKIDNIMIKYKKYIDFWLERNDGLLDVYLKKSYKIKNKKVGILVGSKDFILSALKEICKNNK